MRPRITDHVPALLMLTAFAAAAGARESDRNQPLGVEADQTDAVLQEDGDWVLSGNVLVTQGTLRIDAGNATITRSGGDVARVVFEGAPARMQQENDNGALMRARARRIDYDVNAETVVMTGGVEVTHGGDDLRGERITYDLKSGRMSGAGDGSASGRVRMTIQPRPKSEPAEAADGESGGPN